MQPATAAVDDNLGSAFTVLAEALGIGKENSIPEEADFKEASLTEKLNYIEGNVADLTSAVGSIELNTNSLKSTVEDMKVDVNVSVCCGSGGYQYFRGIKYISN